MVRPLDRLLQSLASREACLLPSVCRDSFEWRKYPVRAVKGESHMRGATVSMRHSGIPRLVVALVVLFSLAVVVVALLLPGAANAMGLPEAPEAYAAAVRDASRLADPTKPFVIAALPDTQIYSALGQVEFRKQIEWVLANAADKNIVFVTHLGDVVDAGTDDAQWANALDALDPLLGQDRLPFSIVRGNHDDPNYFLKNLPLSLMERKPWFVAASPSGLSQAQKFMADGAWFLHIGFGVWPTDAELKWADDLLRQPALQGLPVIVSTHDYLDGNGKTATGLRIWNAFVKNNPMVFMVLCGHNALERAFVSRNAAGLPVYEMLSDYQQFRPFGGNGLMRLITIDPVKDTIEVKTFSPYFEYKGGKKTDTDYYETDRNSQFQYSRALSSALIR
jgi:Calcineurin-like phosphoesterase